MRLAFWKRPATQAPEGTKVLFADVLLEQMQRGTLRDFEGHLISVVLGKPDADGIYTPTFTSHATDVFPVLLFRDMADLLAEQVGGHPEVGDWSHSHCDEKANGVHMLDGDWWEDDAVKAVLAARRYLNGQP